MFNPCEQCKHNCKECTIYIKNIQYKKTNFRLNYQLRRKENEAKELIKKLGVANVQISNLKEEKSKRW